MGSQNISFRVILFGERNYTVCKLLQKGLFLPNLKKTGKNRDHQSADT